VTQRVVVHRYTVPLTLMTSLIRHRGQESAVVVVVAVVRWLVCGLGGWMFERLVVCQWRAQGQGMSRNMFVLYNSREGDLRMLGGPDVKPSKMGFTDAETGDGGSIDNARSINLLIAPACAKAS
jgi:hypothetical protein